MITTQSIPPPIFNANIPSFFLLIFYVLIIVFILHAFFLSYHWFTYGGNKKLSTTALAIYLVGGAVLFLIFSIIINTF